jgi:hypothetical protein
MPNVYIRSSVPCVILSNLDSWSLLACPTFAKLFSGSATVCAAKSNVYPRVVSLNASPAEDTTPSALIPDHFAEVTKLRMCPTAVTF